MYIDIDYDDTLDIEFDDVKDIKTVTGREAKVKGALLRLVEVSNDAPRGSVTPTEAEELRRRLEKRLTKRADDVRVQTTTVDATDGRVEYTVHIDGEAVGVSVSE